MKLLNRAVKELRYAFKIFAPYSDIPKVSIFGSARTAEDHPQYLAAVRFAELIEQAGWMVITGAGNGIMRAGHHGAKREASFGVAISLPFEQSANTIIDGDHKLVNFKYFFTRKLMFVKEARAIVLFPGGFGTQDEGFEALTLVQTGKSAPIPIVLCDEPGGTYWQHWRTYVKSELLHHGMIDEDDMNLFHITDDPEDAAAEILRFYRRYHSSRFVHKDFVLRLRTAISDDELGLLNREFADLLDEGEISQVPKALADEDGEYAALPRLVMRVPQEERRSIAADDRYDQRFSRSNHQIKSYSETSVGPVPWRPRQAGNPPRRREVGLQACHPPPSGRHGAESPPCGASYRVKPLLPNIPG